MEQTVKVKVTEFLYLYIHLGLLIAVQHLRHSTDRYELCSAHSS